MSAYREFLGRLEEERVNIALFRKVVLHCHSPDSHDVSRDHEEFEEKIFTSDLDLVAITDHMKCEFSCRMSELSIDKKPLILPGMEINLRPQPPFNSHRIHVLAVFPERTAAAQIERLFSGDMPVESDRSGNEEVGDIDIKEFIKTIHTNGGLCIAAHVDSGSTGVRSVFRQVGRGGLRHISPDGDVPDEEGREVDGDFKDWMITLGFDGLELARDRDKDHYRWEHEVGGEMLSLPTTLTCDAHNVNDLIGTDRVTYIKMSNVGHVGLKEALRFPDTRIRFPSEIIDVDYPKLLGIEIVSSDDEGFFSSLTVPFSENLNCLIGPRGSGKSTLIEAVRYVLGYNRTLSSIGDLAEKVRSLQENNLKNSIIRLPYKKADGSIVILEATYDSKEDYSTTVLDLDGNDLEVSDVEQSGDYPLRFYGWNEIELLGRKANKQRELLDRLIPELSSVIEEKEIIRTELRSIRNDLNDSVERMDLLINKDGGILRRFNEFKSEFEKLDTEKVRALFVELDEGKLKKRVLSNILEDIETWINLIEESAGFDFLTDPNPSAYGVPGALADWYLETVEKLKLHDKKDSISRQLSAAIRGAREIQYTLASEIEGIDEQIKKSDQEIREIVSVEASMQIAADHRRQARERLDHASEIREQYLKEYQKYETLMEKWRDTSRSLLSKHNEISGLRITKKNEVEEKINELCKDYMEITIEFGGGMDRSDFLDYLREGGFFAQDTHGNYRHKGWPEYITSKFNPVEFINIIIDNEAEKLVGSAEVSDGKIVEVNEDTAPEIIDPYWYLFRDEGGKIDYVNGATMNKVLNLAELAWDDYESILMDGRPVEDLSPGQRSSAMLPLIVLVENAPLVIDQPEDNLDNRLIGGVLVGILANLKEKRQIIVATHNPNIVVLGDSEQVVVLDAIDEKSGKVEHMGSIDNQDIVKSVIDIMEGGEEAFKLRGRRYKFT